MAKPSLFSLSAFAFVLCLSLVACQYPLPTLKLQRDYTSDSAEVLRDTANDVLNLLGTPEQAASVNPQVARQLKSLFKYLVHPLASTDTQVNFSNPIEMVTKRSNMEVANNDDEQIWFAPEAVQELVRLVMDSVDIPHAVEAIRRALDPTPIRVPDVEGSTAANCHLTNPTCNRFISHGLNAYQNFLFNLIVRRSRNIGLNAALNRFDLFHGHLFITRDKRIGILYHAKEYPAESRQFPYYLGTCQTRSPVQYVTSQMNLRNILWLAPYISRREWAPGTLLVLDAKPGGIVYEHLIIDIPEKKVARAIEEDYFGRAAVDTNYLNVGRAGAPDYHLYIC